MMGFLKCSRSSWSSKLDAHPLSFSLSFHTLIALSASVAWQSLLLTLISIDGHLHSPLIRLVDVRLSPFCLLHITPTIIFYSTYSAMSMAHAHVLRGSWKGLRNIKSMKQLVGLSSGLCMMWIFCVVKMEHSQTIWFVGITFLGLVILKRHDCFISRLEVLLFLCQMIDYFFESLVS